LNILFTARDGTTAFLVASKASRAIIFNKAPALYRVASATATIGTKKGGNMAEALGLVASGIAVAQLAGTVVGTIIKLKDYWDQVKDVPAEIQCQLQLLGAFNRILCRIRDSPNISSQPMQHLDAEYLEECCEVCQSAVSELSGLVSRQRSRLDGKRQSWRKKGSAVKIVLQKDEIKKLKGRMKNAVQLLQLALAWRTRWAFFIVNLGSQLTISSTLVETQSSMIVAQLSQNMASILSSSQVHLENTSEKVAGSSSMMDNYSYSYDDRKPNLSQLCYVLGRIRYKSTHRIHNGKTLREVVATYYLPPWLSSSAWHWRQYEKYSGWRTVLQTYRIVPDDSPLFESAFRGGVESIRELLANKQAFVTDKNRTYEQTALHVRCFKKKGFSRL
jgi:hypothetical protein